MPSFRDVPETLRPLARPERDEPPHTHPDDLSAEQAVVDCGIYVDGVRLPGTFTHAAARAKVGELQLAATTRHCSWFSRRLTTFRTIRWC